MRKYLGRGRQEDRKIRVPTKKWSDKSHSLPTPSLPQAYGPVSCTELGKVGQKDPGARVRPKVCPFLPSLCSSLNQGPKLGRVGAQLSPWLYHTCWCLPQPKHSQHNRGDGQEFPRGCELDSIVHLLPVGQQPGFALVWSLEGCPFHRVQEDVHALKGKTFIRKYKRQVDSQPGFPTCHTQKQLQVDCHLPLLHWRKQAVSIYKRAPRSPHGGRTWGPHKGRS